MVTRLLGRALFIRDRAKYGGEIVGIPPDQVRPFTSFIESTIHSVELTDDGKMIIIHRVSNRATDGNGRIYPDRVWKEIYEAVDGKIQLTGQVCGRQIEQKIIPEKLVFPGEEGWDSNQIR